MCEKRGNRSHYKIINGELTPKQGYNTEKEAIEMARFLNSKPNVIHKMVAYKCSLCGKWHIGNNGRILTDKDKEKYSNIHKRENFVKRILC